MSALIFIVQTLLRLALGAVLIRLMMQLSRADFRNQAAQFIVQVTNPLILPLRRILPPMRKIDTASVVAVLLVAIVEVTIVFALSGIGIPPAHIWLRMVTLVIVRTTLWTYFYAIFLYALLGLIVPGGYSPVQATLASICEPVLRPFRRVIPPISGFDLSPLWAGIIIQALLILLG
jgi:YggT family protein